MGRSLIFNSPNCTVCLCLSHSRSAVLSSPSCFWHPPIVPLCPSPTPSSCFVILPPSQFCPPPSHSVLPCLCCLTVCPLFPSFVPYLPGIRSLAGWQADGTDEDDRDWLIPNLLSPCHSRQQRREESKRESARQRVMEPARWSQLSDGESFMVLRTQQLHRARLYGSALLSIFLVGSRCRPSCVYPGFVLSCSPTPLSTSTSYFAVPSFPRFLVALPLDVVKIIWLLSCVSLLKCKVIFQHMTYAPLR